MEGAAELGFACEGGVTEWLWETRPRTARIRIDKNELSKAMQPLRTSVRFSLKLEEYYQYCRMFMRSK